MFVADGQSRNAISEHNLRLSWLAEKSELVLLRLKVMPYKDSGQSCWFLDLQ